MQSNCNPLCSNLKLIAAGEAEKNPENKPPASQHQVLQEVTE